MKQKEPQKPVLQRQSIARPVVILIIALVAVAGLSLLLFFGSKQFVGKAISFGTLSQNEVGFALVQNTLDEGATVTFPVKVNLGSKKSSVLSFELRYDPMKIEVDCSQIYSSLDSLFTGVDENGQQFNLVLHKELSCPPGKVAFAYVALPSIADNKFITGEKTVAEIKVTAKQGQLGAASLLFTSFEVFDLDTGMPIAGLTQKSADFEIVSITPLRVCVDGTWSCEGESATKQCKADGSGYDAPVACASGEACRDGVCTSALPLPPPSPGVEPVTRICVGGTWSCEGESATKQCKADGSGYDAPVACASGEACRDGVCTSALPLPPPPPGVEPVTRVPVTRVCVGSTWSCEGDSATKQCKADGSGYHESVSCAENQLCDAGSCAVFVRGTKITLTDVAPANNVFATKITATEDFTGKEVTIYTILYNAEGKVLALKSEKVENGLAQGETYLVSVSYPETNVKKKSVIVYDVKPGVEVAGSLEVEKS